MRFSRTIAIPSSFKRVAVQLSRLAPHIVQARVVAYSPRLGGVVVHAVRATLIGAVSAAGERVRTAGRRAERLLAAPARRSRTASGMQAG